jgi:hypothetical protein
MTVMNVDGWIATNPESKAVCGWLFWPPDETGRCTFMAHSVVDESGELVDITPIDPNTSRTGLLFLTHLGTEAMFSTMKISHAQVLYPPLNFSEWRESQSIAFEDMSSNSDDL